MPTEKDKILKYSHGKKLSRVPVAYYSDIECLNKQIDTCHNNLDQSSTTRVSKHESCGFSIVAKLEKKIPVTEVKIVWKSIVRS